MKWLFFITVFLSNLVHAQPITISSKDQPLPIFLKTVYADILKADYLIAPALSQSATRVTMEIVFKSREDLVSRLPLLLTTLGVNSTQSGSAFVLSPGTAPSTVAAPPSIAAPSTPSLPSLPSFAPSPTGFNPTSTPTFTPSLAPVSDPVLWHVFKPVNRSPDHVCTVLFPSSKDQPRTVCTLSGRTVLLNLTQKNFDALMPILTAIDSVGQRVEISTALTEVSVTNSKSSGLRVVSKILGGTFEFGTPNVTGSGLTFKAANFSLVLDALGTDSRVLHVVAPSGVVDSGQKLDLAIGDRQPTLAGISTSGNGLAQQSIQYQQAGAILSVLPSVFGDDMIKLSIDSEVSTFSPTSTGFSQSPTISQRKITTSLSLQSGQVVVLGGLRSSKDTDTKHKLFGWSAGSSSSTQTTDLVLLVYAKIIND